MIGTRSALRVWWLLPLALVLALPCASYAQRLTGELSGTVADSTGAILPGASVILTNENSHDQRRTQTNSDGFFAFGAVPSGTYTVDVELSGFSKAEVKG